MPQDDFGACQLAATDFSKNKVDRSKGRGELKAARKKAWGRSNLSTTVEGEAKIQESAESTGLVQQTETRYFVHPGGTL